MLPHDHINSNEFLSDIWISKTIPIASAFSFLLKYVEIVVDLRVFLIYWALEVFNVTGMCKEL